MPGTWRRLDVTPPLSLLPGDELIEPSPGVLVQMRGTVVVATRTLNKPGDVYDVPPIAEARTLSEVFYFQEKRMPGIVQTMTDVIVNQQTGSINFVFAGEGQQYSDFEELQNEQKVDEVNDLARKILIQRAFRRSPDGANLSNMVGGSCAIDLNADTPVVVTDPQE